jgi:hypothetical protein
MVKSTGNMKWPLEGLFVLAPSPYQLHFFYPLPKARDEVEQIVAIDYRGSHEG